MEKIKKLIDDINKIYGKNTVVKVDEVEQEDAEIVSSGSIKFDLSTGIGGFPEGRLIELLGWESSGKTTFAVQAVASAQQSKKKVFYIDAEHSFDKSYAKNLGVKMDGEDALILCQPDNGEQALDIVERLVDSGEFSLGVIDSVAMLIPKVELDGEMTDANMGNQARMMAKFCRKITPKLNKNKCCLIFINQYREKLGVMFGDNKTTPGGNALKFASSMRFDFQKIKSVKSGEEVVGIVTKVRVVKNKMAGTFGQSFETEIIFGKGVQRNSELVDLAVDKGIIKKSGSWFSYGDVKLGQGKESAVVVLNDNLELAEEILTKLLS